ETDPRSTAEDWMRRDLARASDLTQGPLFQFALFRAAPDHFFFYQRLHQIVMDGIGLGIFTRRITASYSMLSQGVPAEANRPGSWFDLLDDEANYRLSERYDRDRDYWQAQLKDRPELVTLSGKPPARFGSPVSRTGRLPRPLADALRALGHGPGASLTQVI